jgi:hypothetical protein
VTHTGIHARTRFLVGVLRGFEVVAPCQQKLIVALLLVVPCSFTNIGNINQAYVFVKWLEVVLWAPYCWVVGRASASGIIRPFVRLFSKEPTFIPFGFMDGESTVVRTKRPRFGTFPTL